MSWQQEYLSRYEQRLKEKWTAEGVKKDEAGLRIMREIASWPPVDFKVAPDKLNWGQMVVGVSKESLYDKYPERAENTREICGND